MIALEPEIAEKLIQIAAQINTWAQAAKEENKSFVRIDMDPGTAEALSNVIGGMPVVLKELNDTRAILAALCGRYMGNTVNMDYHDARWVLAYLEGKVRLEILDNPLKLTKTIRAVAIDQDPITEDPAGGDNGTH